MAYIVLSVIGLVSVLLLRSGWNGKKQASFFLLILVIGLILYGVINLIRLQTGDVPKGATSVLSTIPWLEIGLYFVMLIGMAAKYFYDAIGEGNKIQFQKWQFIKPILISPLVFGTIYSGLGEQTAKLLLLIFSFQNGFFWQTVLYKHTKGT